MVLPLIVKGLIGGVTKGAAKSAASGAAKKFVKGKSKYSSKNRVENIGRNVSKKTKSRPSAKKVSSIKLPKSVYRKSSESSSSTKSTGKVSFESLSKQLESIDKTTQSLVKVAESEKKSRKELNRETRNKNKKEKARKKEEELEKKKGGSSILGVGKTIGKNFNIFDFLTNIALGGLALFLLNNYKKIQNVIGTLSQNFSNPFKLAKSVILGITSVFGGPIKGIFNTAWKGMKKAGSGLKSLMKKVVPKAQSLFGGLGSGLVNFVKNVTSKFTGGVASAGASGAASAGASGATQGLKGGGRRPVSAQASQSASKTATNRVTQQASKRTAKNLFGTGGNRILKIGNIFKRVPVVGGLLSIFIDMLLGEPLDRAVVGAVGGGIGAWIGGGIGSLVFPFAGTAAGAILGGMIGDWGGKALYELIKKKFSSIPPVSPQKKFSALPWWQQMMEDEPWINPQTGEPIIISSGLGYLDQSETTGTTSTPTSTTSGGGSDFWTLAAIASREDGDDQGRADVIQSIYNRAASGAYGSKNIRDLILGPTQYQPTWDYPNGSKNGYGIPNDEWLNIVDAQSAALAAGWKDTKQVERAAAIINNPTLMKNAKDFLGGRTDFTNYTKEKRRGEIIRQTGGRNNYFGWDWNYTGTVSGSAPNFNTITQQTGSTQQKIAVLAYGTNEWGRDRSYIVSSTKKLIKGLMNKGYRVVVVPPSDKLVVKKNPKGNVVIKAPYQGVTTAAAEMGCQIDYGVYAPIDFLGNYIHLTPSSARAIKNKYKPDIVVGDSNAALIRGGQSATAKDGAAYAQVSQMISNITPTSPSPQQAQLGSTGQNLPGIIQKKGATTGTNDNDLISGFPVTSPYRSARRPDHEGIDIGTPEGTYVALDVDVEILFSGLHGRGPGHGYGNVIDAWAPSLKLQFRLAHLNELLVKKGQKIPAGVPLGRTGGAIGDRARGSSTGPHLHFEVDNVKNRIRYGGLGDPSPYVGHLILSSAGPVGQASGQNINLSPQQAASQSRSGIDRRASYESGYSQGGGVVPVPISSQTTPGGGGGRGVPMMGGPSTKEVLNSYYKSQLMGFLYKQG
jgi:murein DD-endopeptidase MepM/ murein hydrolase activator NlpD